jgi:hypothetical protein
MRAKAGLQDSKWHTYQPPTQKRVVKLENKTVRAIKSLEGQTEAVLFANFGLPFQIGDVLTFRFGGETNRNISMILGTEVELKEAEDGAAHCDTRTTDQDSATATYPSRVEQAFKRAAESARKLNELLAADPAPASAVAAEIAKCLISELDATPSVLLAEQLAIHPGDHPLRHLCRELTAKLAVFWPNAAHFEEQINYGALVQEVEHALLSVAFDLLLTNLEMHRVD